MEKSHWVPAFAGTTKQAMKRYKIAVIPGDGIGREVVPEGLRVLEAAGRKFGIEFKWEEFP